MRKNITTLLVLIIFLLSTLLGTIVSARDYDVYTVVEGDSLWIISRKYQINLYDLIGANPQIVNPDLIYPMQEIYVPVITPDIPIPTPMPEPLPEPTEPMPDPGQLEPKIETPTELSEFERQVVDLVNAERAKQGLKALVVDGKVTETARAKAKDLAENNYFSHTSPTYGSPFEMLTAFGVEYSAAGENIAKGQKTPEDVMDAWMSSEGHRSNILNPNFTHIGVGFFDYNWVQMFIRK